MTRSSARKWIVTSSLMLAGAILVFFFVAPWIGFPIDFHQSLRVLEITVPVFAGYLGTATLYLFKKQHDMEANFPEAVENLVGLLVRGPIVLFAFAIVALIFGFGMSNSRDAGPGMSLDELCAGISILLGLLAITTNAVVTFLF